MNIRLPPVSINRGGRFIESTSKMAVGRNGMHREWRKRGKGAFGLYDKQTSSSPSSRLMTKTAHFLSCESHANHRGLYQLLLVFGFQRRGTARLACVLRFCSLIPMGRLLEKATSVHTAETAMPPSFCAAKSNFKEPMPSMHTNSKNW